MNLPEGRRGGRLPGNQPPGAAHSKTREQRVAFLHSGWVGGFISLSHTPGESRSFFSSLKPSSSSPGISVEKLHSITCPSQGPSPPIFYCSSYWFVLVALANTRRSRRSVLGKRDGRAPGGSRATWLNKGILFLQLHTYRALFLLKAQRTILALILPQQDAIRFKKIQLQKEALKKIIEYFLRLLYLCSILRYWVVGVFGAKSFIILIILWIVFMHFRKDFTMIFSINSGLCSRVSSWWELLWLYYLKSLCMPRQPSLCPYLASFPHSACMHRGSVRQAATKSSMEHAKTLHNCKRSWKGRGCTLKWAMEKEL